MNKFLLHLCLGVALSGAVPAAHAAETGAPLRVGVTPTMPPMVFKQADKLAGIDIDLANEIGRALERPIQFVEVPWPDQIQALLDGRTDVIMSSMSITQARMYRVSFTKPYMFIGQMLLIRGEDMNRYALGIPPTLPAPVGVRTGTTGDFLAQQEFPRSKRKDFKTTEEASRALIKKKVASVLTDSPQCWWLAARFESEGLTTVPILLSNEQLAWAVRKSDGPLLEALNGTLDQMTKDGTLQRVIKHWIPISQ